MAYTTVNKCASHYSTKLFTGNGSTTQAITGVGFQPDWFWIKCRNEVADNQLSDVLRGKSGSLYYQLQSNGNGAQVVQGDNDGVHSLDSDGFTVGYTNSVAWNKSGNTYATWNWKAGGTGSANTAGTINSTVSVNTTSGFSIVKYTGNGTSGATVGHGLGAVPKMIIVKQYNSSGGSENWGVYHVSNGNTKYMFLNSNAVVGTNSGYWNDTTPSSTVFTLGNNDVVNNNTVEYVAYCFAEKIGYSKFGSYTGTNSSGNAPFVYTGFRPSYLVVKSSSTDRWWTINDDKRNNSFNPANRWLYTNASNVEFDATSYGTDFLSNGFKIKHDGSYMNESATYIYWAFGQTLVGSNNIPCTAR